MRGGLFLLPLGRPLFLGAERDGEGAGRDAEQGFVEEAGKVVVEAVKVAFRAAEGVGKEVLREAEGVGKVAFRAAAEGVGKVAFRAADEAENDVEVAGKAVEEALRAAAEELLDRNGEPSCGE